MGTIISKDTRRISFENTISVNPILIQKSAFESNDLAVEDFKENFKSKPKRLKMQDDEQDYWTQRVDRLKNEHNIIYNIIEKEYDKTIEKLHTLREPQQVTREKINDLKPCLDWRLRLVRCYEDNPRQTLLCSAVAQAFCKCVTACQLKD